MPSSRASGTPIQFEEILEKEFHTVRFVETHDKVYVCTCS